MFPFFGLQMEILVDEENGKEKRNSSEEDDTLLLPGNRRFHRRAFSLSCSKVLNVPDYFSHFNIDVRFEEMVLRVFGKGFERLLPNS